MKQRILRESTGGVPTGLSVSLMFHDLGCDVNVETQRDQLSTGEAGRALTMGELILFGEAADAQQQHHITEGGFIVPERLGPEGDIRGKEKPYVRQGVEGARGARARPRPGRQAPAAASGAAAYPVERGIGEGLGLGELFDYHKDARWIGLSPSSAWLALSVGLFRTLPRKAHLVLELPRTWSAWATRAIEGSVPFMRAWAVWDDGILVHSHHAYPDLSACACLPEEWRPHRNVVEDYVGYCVCWIGKALYLQLLGRWPGPQHCPASVLVARRPPDEFCHCGEPRRYRDCHMPEDATRKLPSLVTEAALGRRAYLDELRFKALDGEGPFHWRTVTPPMGSIVNEATTTDD